MEETKNNIEVPEKFKSFIAEIEKMNVLELAELVKALEQKFGVSASAVMVGAASNAVVASDATEERTSFDVELKDAGAQRIAVIKIVREITNLGLKEAKDVVDGAPRTVKGGLARAEAEEMKKKLEEAGAVVELK